MISFFSPLKSHVSNSLDLKFSGRIVQFHSVQPNSSSVLLVVFLSLETSFLKSLSSDFSLVWTLPFTIMFVSSLLSSVRSLVSWSPHFSLSSFILSFHFLGSVYTSVASWERCFGAKYLKILHNWQCHYIAFILHW